MLVAVFEPFWQNEFSIDVGMYNKGNPQIFGKLREI
jgi:hypothetical protein